MYRNPHFHCLLTSCKVERKPGIHLGPQVISLDQIGIETDRMKKYREIIECNRKEREHQQERKRNRERERGR